MRHLACFLMVVGVSVVLGCGQSSGLVGVTKVTGTVTYQGKPVDDASVIFSPDGAGKPAAGKTDASGRFQLTTLTANDGALPGKYKVSISKGIDADVAAHQITAEEMTKAISSGKSPPMGPTKGGPQKGSGSVKQLIPDKYKDAQKSGLTADVTSGGKNDFPFTLD